MLNIKKGGMVHIKLGQGGNNLILERTGIYEHHLRYLPKWEVGVILKLWDKKYEPQSSEMISRTEWWDQGYSDGKLRFAEILPCGQEISYK